MQRAGRRKQRKQTIKQNADAKNKNAGARNHNTEAKNNSTDGRNKNQSAYAKKKRPGKILQDVWIMFEYSGLLPEKHHYCRYKVNS